MLSPFVVITYALECPDLEKIILLTGKKMNDFLTCEIETRKGNKIFETDRVAMEISN